MSWVFANGPGERSSVPGRVLPKIQKWYLMLACLTLSIIRYGSRVKWSNPENEVVHSQHIVVVAIEKGAFESPSTKGDNFTLLTRVWIKVFCSLLAKMHSQWCLLKICPIQRYCHVLCKEHKNSFQGNN